MGDKYIEQAQDAAWTEYERFKKDYELSLKNNKAFPDIVKDIMDREKLTIEKLVNKSLLDRQTINRFRTGKIKTKTRVMDYVPSMRSIIAFCIACNMDMLNTVTLLESLGLTFRRTGKVDYAYSYLIVNYRGKSIPECNAVLKNLWIDDGYLLRDPDNLTQTELGQEDNFVQN